MDRGIFLLLVAWAHDHTFFCQNRENQLRNKWKISNRENKFPIFLLFFGKRIHPGEIRRLGGIYFRDYSINQVLIFFCENIARMFLFIGGGFVLGVFPRNFLFPFHRENKFQRNFHLR